MLSQGRYAQNQCYLGKLLADAFPEILKQRWKFKVEDVVPLGNVQLLTFKPDSIRLRSSRTAMAQGGANRPLFPIAICIRRALISPFASGLFSIRTDSRHQRNGSVSTADN